MPVPHSKRGATTRLPVLELLDQLRDQWEELQAESLELAAENDRLRQHMALMAMFRQPLDDPDSPVAPTRRIHRDDRRRPSFPSPTNKRYPFALPVALPKPDLPVDNNTPRSTASSSGAADETNLEDSSEPKDLPDEVPQPEGNAQDRPVLTSQRTFMSQRTSQPTLGSQGTSMSMGMSSHSLGPDDLQMHPIWTQAVRRRSGSSMRRKSTSKNSKPALMRTRTLQNIRMNCVFHPNSKFVNMWDSFIIVMLIFDLIFVPLQAFDLSGNTFLEVMELVATSVWTCDMLLCFFKGIEKNGAIEMRPRYIVHRYITTWFAFDLCLVGVDWWLLFSAAQGGAIIRARRLVRLIRLARVLKHGSRFIDLLNLIRSDFWIVIFRIFGLLLALVAINHFVCCGWYAIGTVSIFEESWTDRAFEAEDSNWYRYSTSFHWSVTQFTPASMEVVPVNALERLYNITSILFGLLVFSAFVSNMTNSMTYLTRIQYEKGQQKELLKRYINNKGLSLQLSMEIVSNIGGSAKKKGKRLLEKDISCIADMPKPLLQQLHYEVHAPVLDKHPLLQEIKERDFACFLALCDNAAGERASLESEEIFRFGQRCSSMMFVVSGRFTYSPGFGGSQILEDVEKGMWLCEASLWVKWEHRGSLSSASKGCELALLDVAEAHHMFGCSMMHQELRKYAALYAKTAAQQPDRISDTWGQGIIVAHLVQQIFKDMNDVEAAAAKILSIAGPSDEFSSDRCFKAWRTLTRREKHLRRKGLLGIGCRSMDRIGILDRVLS